MLGSIGFPEILLILLVILLLFGPKKMPEMAKLLGTAIREFKKTVNDAKTSIQEELDKSDISEDLLNIKDGLKDITNIKDSLKNSIVDEIGISDFSDKDLNPQDMEKKKVDKKKK